MATEGQSLYRLTDDSFQKNNWTYYLNGQQDNINYAGLDFNVLNDYIGFFFLIGISN